MATAYLSLGSNIGDRHRLLQEAVVRLSMEAGAITALSSFYETAPVGFESSHTFINIAIALDTTLSPQVLLAVTQHIEKELGRGHKSIDGIYHDRTIDIDLLIMGDYIVDTPQLTLPHPRMLERQFVLEPLHEIAPDLVHPSSHRTIAELWHDYQRNLSQEACTSRNVPLSGNTL
ncbi:MAG: 2-amino-4-hydroxy-6-hydroxymethyldihydropteridine diphosphokinase [Coprobacter sp.]|nr:2-amino-4-hydroxy-6-hydroxymethyldihydropteridine diphosphokinase [Coprobacter sp.]